MENTGERYLPEYDGDWTLEHMHRYLAACELAAGKDVLDIASGEGYGAAMLASVARRVTGVDIDAACVEGATAKYGAENIVFRRANAMAIPLEAHSVDLVVSFETIEHVADQAAMMAEIKRVLRPGGLLVMSSPDKREYSDVPDFHNAYHIRELYRDEFENLLRSHFAHYRITGQRVVFGSVMGAEEPSRFVTWSKDEKDGPAVPVPGLARAEYLVAVAGDAPVPPLPCGLYETPLEQSDRVRWLKTHLDGSWRRIEDLERRLKEAEDAIQYLEPHYKVAEATSRKLREAEEKLRATEEQLSSVLHSRSWRATKPFRSAGKRLRALKRLVKKKAQPEAAAQPLPIWPPDVRALRLDEPFTRTAPVTDAPDIGVFAHMFYPELADEVLACLDRLPPAAVHLSTDTEEKRAFLQERFLAAGHAADIRVCPNKGWDIAPFLVGFGDVIANYSLILRLHSKRSPQLGDGVGDAWRAMLYASLAGSTERVNAILNAFATRSDLGMVCPPILPHYADAVHFGGNYDQMRTLLADFGVVITPDTAIDFPMGSMFWCRPQVLTPWLDRKFSYDNFAPLADDIRDSSLGHAMERLFLFGCGLTGYRWARLPDGHRESVPEPDECEHGETPPPRG